MKLKPKIGIGDLIFGMSPEQVYMLLGKPDREYIDLYDDNHIHLEYYSLQLNLTFDKEEGTKLSSIHTSNEALTYNGLKVLNRRIADVTQGIFKLLVKKWDVSAYNLSTCYTEYDYWLTLNVEYDRVKSIELSVSFKNDEEHYWPPLPHEISIEYPASLSYPNFVESPIYVESNSDEIDM